MRPVAWRRLVAGVGLACLSAAGARAQASAPKVDARGLVDIWALRAEWQSVEALHALALRPACEAERDRASQSDTAAARRALKTCEDRVVQKQRHYEQARGQFNLNWGPALRDALQRGDPVAEVVLRQCRITAELDRSDVESTCDPDWVRQQVANQRLRQIGFTPAIDPPSPSPAPGQPPEKGAVLRQALARMAEGDFSLQRMDAYMGGNGARTPEDLENYRRWYAIETLQARAWRVFSIDMGFGDSIGGRPGHAPALPDDPTWGADFNRGNSGTVVPKDQVREARSVYLEGTGGTDRRHLVGGPADAAFLQLVATTFAASEAAIERWLRVDPRWGAFLLLRVGDFEWVPFGQPVTSGHLEPAWAGRYVLVRAFSDFLEQPVARPARALIGPVDGETRVQMDFDPAGGGSANCMLRYSGGRSLLPTGGRHEAEISNTVIGYLPNLSRRLTPFDPGPVAPFAPLDPKRRYRQVLVQCPQGEWPGNRQVRMFYLAAGTLVEIFRPAGGETPVQVRHWQREAIADAPAPPPAGPGVAEMLQAREAEWHRVQDLAAQAQAAESRWRNASTGELLAMLATSRIETRSYARDEFPENVKRLERRAGIVAEVCSAYRAKPPDTLVRFNLVALLAMRLKDGTAGAEAGPAADCLRQALADPQPWVRGEAAWGLRFGGRAGDAEALRALLDDADPAVREHAQAALRALGR